MRAALLVALLALAAEAAPGKDELRQARALYQRGNTQYSLRNFEGAIADFKTAYELTGEPGLLFDIAQASRLAQRADDARHFYSAYLRQAPNAPNRRDVEELIEQLPPPPPPRAAPRAPAPRPPVLVLPRAVEPAPTGRVQLGVGLALLGTALGLGAGGLALGLAAHSESDQISAAATRGGAWDAELDGRWNDGQRDAAAATALYVISGAAAIAGVTLTAIGAKRMKHLSLGTRVAWSCDF